jgi:subtilisin family serine protease
MTAGFGQMRMSQKTIWTVQDLTSKAEGSINQKWVEEHAQYYPVYQVYGKYCLSMVGVKNDNFNEADLAGLAYLGSEVGDIVTIKFPVENLAYINQVKNLEYLEVADRIAGMSNARTVKDARVDSVWMGYGLSQPYTGKNVLIGVTDWGFDYNHPMFMDTTLTTSRIRAAWDHFKISGDQPTGYGYGVEYDTPTELSTAESDTASTYYDYATHGSHVAGIAGGSGAGTEHRGIAFEAEFLFNSIQLDVGAAIDAFNWMKGIADTDGKRLVINMSWGLYYIGTMDGTSLVSQAIDNLTAQGVVFVTSAGNNGDADFHLKKDFSGDTLRSRIQFYGYHLHNNMWGQSISSWGEVGNSYAMQLEIYDNAGNLLDSTPTYTTNDVGYHDSIVVIGTDTIFYNYTIESAHVLNNRPMIWARVKNTNTALFVVMKTYASSGRVHYWNVVELDNGVGNWGLNFISYGNGGAAGDPAYGVGEPACTESAITVAAHGGANFNQSGTEYPGSLAGFSSEGPTYDERMKPDVSAPGVGVISSINSYTTASYSTNSSITFNGRTYDFSSFSGTSMSSPAVAGVAALMLEANSGLTAPQLKDMIKSAARQDNKTGSISWPGDPDWGMGKMTATRAVALAENTVSVQSLSLDTELKVYPNPFTDVLNIANETGCDYQVYALTGKLIQAGKVQGASLSLSSLKAGVYLLVLDTDKGKQVFKVTKH